MANLLVLPSIVPLVRRASLRRLTGGFFTVQMQYAHALTGHQRRVPVRGELRYKLVGSYDRRDDFDVDRSP